MLKEFLMAMASLRAQISHGTPSPGVTTSAPTLEEDIRMYFDLFVSYCGSFLADRTCRTVISLLFVLRVQDLDQNGHIDRSEMKVMLECILQDSSHSSRFSARIEESQHGSCRPASIAARKYHPSSSSNFDEMFDLMDSSQDDVIDFVEFRQFFNVLFDGEMSPALKSDASVTLSSANDPSDMPTVADSIDSISICQEKQSPTSASSSPRADTKKAVGAGLAARMAALDHSKIIMPGTVPPPSKHSQSERVRKETKTDGDADGAGALVNMTLGRAAAPRKRHKPRNIKKFSV